MQRATSIGPGSTRRWSAARKLVVASAAGGLVALAVLTAAAFSPSETIDVIGIAALAVSLLLACLGVLMWRVPVMSRPSIVGVGVLWAAGIAVSAYLACLTSGASRGLVWQRSVQALAVALSFTVGALFLRGLLRKRTAPVVARILSLISPLAIVLLILLSSSRS